MSDQKKLRASIQIPQDVSLKDVAGSASRPAPSLEQQQQIKEEAEARGFARREARRRRRVTPYTAQFSGRCRPEVRALFHEAVFRLDVKDSRALELAFKALFDANGFKDLSRKYDEILARRRPTEPSSFPDEAQQQG